ncbi:helix-turn-helix domain-containing protein [Niveispirillum fermenti]|uniref:helix-turn-helix domain-containing protein n=1 Tax=Niveispirillum fermenti TaxID=1233113 RepID=UPI003A83DC6D
MLTGSTLMAAPHANGMAAPAQHMVRGDLDLRLDTGRVQWRGRPVPLTMTECKMVRLMAQRPGTGVTYRDLYDLVHGPGFMAGKGASGYRANVRAFIKRIRKKFRDIDDGFDAIINDPGTGYSWAKQGEAE